MKAILTRKYPLRGEMTYARSLTYKHLIKLGDDYDAVQLRGQKKIKKILIGNLPLLSPEQTKEKGINITSKY